MSRHPLSGILLASVLMFVAQHLAIGKALQSESGRLDVERKENFSQDFSPKSSEGEEKQALAYIKPYIVRNMGNVDGPYKATISDNSADLYKEPDAFSEQIGAIPFRANIIVQPTKQKAWVRARYAGSWGYLYTDQITIDCESRRADERFIQLGYYFSNSAIRLRADLEAYRENAIQNLKVFSKNKNGRVEYWLVLGPYRHNKDIENAVAQLERNNIQNYEIRLRIDDEPIFYQTYCVNESIIEKKVNQEQARVEEFESLRVESELERATAEIERRNKQRAKKQRKDAERKENIALEKKHKLDLERKKIAADAALLKSLSGKWSGLTQSSVGDFVNTVNITVRVRGKNSFFGTGKSKLKVTSLMSLLVYNCFSELSFSGTVDGVKFRATATGKNGSMVYSGNISGNRVDGVYDVVSGKCKIDEGTFSFFKE